MGEMKKACQHYLFYWFNSKGSLLKLYVAFAGSIENTATNKKRFPEKLFSFIYFIFCASWLRFCVQVAPISSSLQVTIMVFKTTLILAKASLALKEGKIISTGLQHKSLQVLCLKTANIELPYESSLCCLNYHGNWKRFLTRWWSLFQSSSISYTRLCSIMLLYFTNGLS